MQLLLVNQIVHSFVHSFIHSLIIQSSASLSDSHKSHYLPCSTRSILILYTVYSLPCSNTLLISYSSIIPFSRHVFLLYLSISICPQRSLVVRSFPLQRCHSLLSSLRYLVTFVRHSLLVTPPTKSIRSLRVPHTGRSKCNRPLCSMPIVPAASLFVPISSLLCCSRCSTAENKTK